MVVDMKYMQDGDIVAGKRFCMSCGMFHEALYLCPDYSVAIKDQIIKLSLKMFFQGENMPEKFLNLLTQIEDREMKTWTF